MRAFHRKWVETKKILRKFVSNKSRPICWNSMKLPFSFSLPPRHCFIEWKWKERERERGGIARLPGSRPSVPPRRACERTGICHRESGFACVRDRSSRVAYLPATMLHRVACAVTCRVMEKKMTASWKSFKDLRCASEHVPFKKKDAQWIRGNWNAVALFCSTLKRSLVSSAVLNDFVFFFPPSLKEIEIFGRDRLNLCEIEGQLV